MNEAHQADHTVQAYNCPKAEGVSIIGCLRFLPLISESVQHRETYLEILQRECSYYKTDAALVRVDSSILKLAILSKLTSWQTSSCERC
jgi:hypothetical protein